MNFFYSQRTDLLWGPASYAMAAVGALSPWLKRRGLEADHSSPCSAEVNNDGALPPLPNMSSWHGLFVVGRGT
jgi:hypothetical protein